MGEQISCEMILLYTRTPTHTMEHDSATEQYKPLLHAQHEESREHHAERKNPVQETTSRMIGRMSSRTGKRICGDGFQRGHPGEGEGGEAGY